MACKVYETFGQEHPTRSIRFENLFNAVEAEKTTQSSNEKIVKYALLDGFPETFTVTANGTFIAKGKLSDPNNMVNIVNSTIARHFGMPLFSASQLSNNRISLEFNDDILNTEVYSAAREITIPTMSDDRLKEVVRQNRANKTIARPERDTSLRTVEQSAAEAKRDKFTVTPTVEEQLKHLKETFASAGINVKVRFDSKMSQKGTVEKVEDNLVEIKLNPTIMAEDTHYHEFAHILIDLLGENNKLVKEASKMILETELYRQIRELYSDKSDEFILKEALVTAIGMKAALRTAPANSKDKLLTIIRKLLRAIKNEFKLNDDALELLVDKLLSKKLDTRELTGELSEEIQESRAIDAKLKDFRDMVGAVSETLQVQLDKFESMPVKNDEVIANLRAHIKTMREVKKIEDFSNFLDYLNRAVKLNRESLNAVVAQKDTIKDLSEDDKFAIQRDMLNVGNLIKDLLGGGERSVLSQIEESILEKKDTLGRQGKESSKLTEMEEKVADLIKSLKRQQKIYNKIGLEVQVDILLDYVTPEIDSLLQNTIDNIKTNRRLISIIKDEKYDALKKRFQEDELTKEEYENELIELNIEQLENKKLGRETLLNELREAQTDKSGYSVYMDPLMYSTQVTLQLFGSMVKNKLYQASADTREIIDELAPIYREYANYKGTDIDPKKFNSEILETQVYYVDDPKTGFKKRMEILSFVQPYDVTKFHEDEYSMRKTLAEKYEMPKNVDYEVFKEWKKSDKGVSYFREVAKWYNRNTVRTEEGALLKDKLTARLRDVSAKAKLVEGTNPDLYIAYEAQIIDLKSQIGRIYDSVNDQYKGMAVRPNSNYANPRYSQLIDASGNPIGAAGAYYKGFLDVYHRQQRIVGKQTPLKNDWDDVSYVVPSVESQGLEKIQQDSYNVFKSAVHFAKREFSFLETDDSYGMSINANKEQRNKIVPVFYSNPTDAKFVSHDIGSTIVLYAGMANMFKRKSEITGAVIMMRDIVERREVLEVNANNVPFLSAAARKAGVTRHTRRKGEVSNNFQHLSEFIDKIFFGESEIKSSINIGNATISGNKIINKLTTFTALNQLSLNFLQAGNQYLIDNEKLMEEAVAGQFFNAKNLTWAKLTYGKLLLSGDTVKDMGKFSPDTKLSRFIAEFDILGDALNDYKTKKTGNRAFKAMGRDALFFAQHMAEHETAVTRGLAIADSLKGKLKDVNGEVIKNEDGSEANLWDLYKQDEKTGKWDLDSRVANYKKINIINLISGVYKKTNQIKTDFDDPLINRRWWGKALAMYRRYFQPGLRRRFGYGIGTGLHIDTETDTITEGMYTSFVRYMRESISKGFKFGSVYQMLSEDFEKPNVKRTTAEISMLVAVTVIGTILLGMLDDDDEEDDQFATAFFAYQALRMQAELAQFWNPAEFYRFIASPTALSRPIVDAALLIDQLLTEELPYRIKLALDVELDDEDTKQIFYQKNSNGHLKGESKTAAMGNKLLPISNGLSKSFSPEEALKFFTQ